jgi:hypothetical protein
VTCGAHHAGEGATLALVPQRSEETNMKKEQMWGHCKNCKYFKSPAKTPVDTEEAACAQPTLAKYTLRVFGASGCNAFQARMGLAAEQGALRRHSM